MFNIYKYELKYKNDSKNRHYNILIIEKQKQDSDKVTYIAKLNTDKFLLNIYTTNLYDSEKNLSKYKVNEVTNYTYGDYIKIKGKISIPEMLGNKHEFNYKRYLNSKDIIGNINVYEVEYVDNTGNIFTKTIYSIKQTISKYIDYNLKEDKAELLKGMIYGDTRNLDKDIKDTFNEIGISHITAVSGSNLSIILLITSILFQKVKRKKIVYILIQIVIIVCFSILAGLELSVVRAAIMSIISIICDFKNIKLSIEKVLLISLYIITIINPYRIFNTGMVFSFFAILGLIFFYGKIYNFIESKIKWNIKNRVMSRSFCFLASVISITVSVNVFVLPLSIYTFNKFSIIFVLSNLLVSTLSTLINLFGILSIIIFKIPILTSICFKILDILLKLLLCISNFLKEINISFSVKSFPIVILILYYMYISTLCISLKSNKKYIKYNLKKFKKIIVYSLISCVAIVGVKNIFFDNYIYFFNVGQGEMAIVKNKGTVIMIDSGSITNDSAYIFESYMKKENINEIDALVISHFHSDHVNGIKEIIEMCNIRYLIYSYPYDLNSEIYTNFIKEINKSEVKHIIVNAGDSIKINDIDLSVLFPGSDYITVSNKIDENENANSLVININVNNKNYLFMGDLLKESEENVIEQLKKQNIINIEIVKVGHHGSKTSTSEGFIQFTLPKYAIISSKKKVYNHPNSETISLLKKYSVIIYITEKVGGIKYII